VAGGAFVSGGTGNARVAQWNGASWQMMGNGLGLANGAHRVTSVAVYQNQLYAGGWFQSGNGQNVVEGIARWDGSSWRAVGGRMIGEVHALLVHNGELIVGGIFSQAGGQPISGIARWNGTSWQPLGTGITGSAGVYALATYNGDLIAGGRFFSVGGVNTGHIARWDGAAWHDMQGGLSGGFSTTVWDLAVFNGELIVAGEFTNAGGVPVSWLARWNGAWSAQQSGLSSAAAGLGIFHGELCVAGGFMTAGPQMSALFARWSPTGVPWIARQPAGSQVAPGGTVHLSLAAATGYGNLGYRWRRGGVELIDGPTAHGSTIVGAATPALTVLERRRAGCGVVRLHRVQSLRERDQRRRRADRPGRVLRELRRQHRAAGAQRQRLRLLQQRLRRGRPLRQLRRLLDRAHPQRRGLHLLHE
jgi:hypothetical protein